MAWAPDYVTTSDQKSFMRIGDSVDDAQIAVAITTASRAVDDYCNRQFGLVDLPEQRYYRAWADYQRMLWMVDIDDLMSTLGFSVTIGGTTITSANYTLESVNAPAKGRPWTRLAIAKSAEAQPCGLSYDVAAYGAWGWSAVPVPVQQATYLQASRFLARRDSPYGIAGSPDQGSELRLLARLDPDVAVSLRSYRRQRAVG